MPRESQNLQNVQEQQQAFNFQQPHRQTQEEALRNGLTLEEFNKAKITQFQLDERWPQALLPYKRDKQNKSKITDETRENYEIDRKLLRAFQETNTKKQIAAIARIYLKQSLPEFTEEDLSKENIFSDLISEVTARMGDHPDPLLRYMSRRLADPCRSLMNTAYELPVQTNIGNKMSVSLPLCFLMRWIKDRFSRNIRKILSIMRKW